MTQAEGTAPRRIKPDENDQGNRRPPEPFRKNQGTDRESRGKQAGDKSGLEENQDGNRGGARDDSDQKGESPVVIMKVVRARVGPIRSIMIPEMNKTPAPKIRERPIRVLAQGDPFPFR